MPGLNAGSAVTATTRSASDHRSTRALDRRSSRSRCAALRGKPLAMVSGAPTADAHTWSARCTATSQANASSPSMWPSGPIRGPAPRTPSTPACRLRSRSHTDPLGPSSCTKYRSSCPSQSGSSGHDDGSTNTPHDGSRPHGRTVGTSGSIAGSTTRSVCENSDVRASSDAGPAESPNRACSACPGSGQVVSVTENSPLWHRIHDRSRSRYRDRKVRPSCVR